MQPSVPDGCRAHSELLEEYELVDPKDPTVNVRVEEDGEVVAQPPVGSRVLLLEDGPLTKWTAVLVQPPPLVVRGFVPKVAVRVERSGQDASLVAHQLGAGIWKVPVRAQPDEKAAVLGEVESGPAKMIGEKGPWIEVEVTRTPDPIEGVVHKSRLKKIGKRKPSTLCGEHSTP